MKAWPPPKSLVKVAEKFSLMILKASSNFIAGDVVDFLDGGLGVVDGVEEVLALGFEEARGVRRSRCTPRAPSC